MGNQCVGPSSVLHEKGNFGQVNALGLALLVFQRGVDHMNLPGLRFCEPRPGPVCLSIVRELNLHLGLLVSPGCPCTTFQAVSQFPALIGQARYPGFPQASPHFPVLIC